MKNHKKLSIISVTVCFLFGLIQIAAANSIAHNIEESDITSIIVEIADNNLDQFGFKLTPSIITEKVNKNLSEWHFPIEQNNHTTSHLLSVTIGKIEVGNTPVGFSFSSGNSDPRSSSFQKAQVLPISCYLKKIGQANIGIENKATVSTYGLLDNTNQTTVTDKLVNHISTACFELLDELQLPATGNRLDTHTFKPTWMPDVQIEVQNVPAVGINTPALNTEKLNTETRKKIIIHNQGTPVIIELGHERK